MPANLLVKKRKVHQNRLIVTKLYFFLVCQRATGSQRSSKCMHQPAFTLTLWSSKCISRLLWGLCPWRGVRSFENKFLLLWGLCPEGVCDVSENKFLWPSRNQAGVESSSLHLCFSQYPMEETKLKVFLLKQINSNNLLFSEWINIDPLLHTCLYEVCSLLVKVSGTD